MFEILADATLAALSRQLMGCAEVLSHSIFNARPKLPQQSWTDTPWHQDAQYYPDAGQPGGGHHVISLWIPTQPVSERNSCMEVAKNCPLETTALYDGPPPLLPLTSLSASSSHQQPGLCQAGRIQ